jgi:hypothetical protein
MGVCVMLHACSVKLSEQHEQEPHHDFRQMLTS